MRRCSPSPSRLVLAAAVVAGLATGGCWGVGAGLAAAPPKGAAPLVSDISPGKGKGVAPAKAQGNGPWATRIVLAASADGLAFASTGEIVADQAGVPALVVDPERRLRAYYVDWANGNTIAVAIRTAPRTWVYRRVTVRGALPKPPGSDPVDPAVVVLPDGRYRLYYMQGSGGGPAGGPGGPGGLAIYSAISSDGIAFTREPGVRLTPPDRQTFDPTVLKTRAGWLLWTGPDGAHFATSPDGLRFTARSAFTVDGTGFMVWAATALHGGGYRVYGNVVGPGGEPASSASSADGVSWRLDAGRRLAGGAPDVGVAVLDPRHWAMAYLTLIP